MKNELTSARIAAIAAKGIKDPASLTPKEIRAICASALTQRPDKRKKAPVSKGK